MTLTENLCRCPLQGAGGGTPLPGLLNAISDDDDAPTAGGVSASASLDSGTPPLETSDGRGAAHIERPRYGSPEHDDYGPSLPSESQFRHSGWSARRRRVYDALMRTGQSVRRSQNFAECGSTLWVLRDGDELSLVCNRCHDRLCEPCQRERQAAVVEGVLLKCHDAATRLRFSTLTLRHADIPLALQLDRLVASFKLLRSHPAIKDALLGGTWFIEVKLDRGDRLWHPHLHVIMEGSFIDQKSLSKAWYEVTGDSYIVDIRQIDDVANRASYVAKYATKPLHSRVSLFAEKLDEFVQAIKGRRLYTCFGTWVGAVKRPPPTKPKGRLLARVDTLWRDSLNGDADALGTMRILHGRFPKLRVAYPLPTTLPRPPDPMDF